ncbi:hypothetical protein EMCRGX_G004877 [Ephydatia muelleri]
MDSLFKERMTAIATAKGASTKSCVLSQERYPPVGIFPGAEKHWVDEEDLPITPTCDDPHTATLRTEPSTDTAAQNSLSSPSIRDNAEGCVNLVSPCSCVAPQSVSGPKDADVKVEHSTLKLSSQVSETPDKQQEEDEGDSKSTIHTASKGSNQV